MSANCSTKIFQFNVDRRISDRLKVEQDREQALITFYLKPPLVGSNEVFYEKFGFVDVNNEPLPATVAEGVPETQDRYTLHVTAWKDGEPVRPHLLENV